jgi:hypothetical protein
MLQNPPTRVGTLSPRKAPFVSLAAVLTADNFVGGAYRQVIVRNVSYIHLCLPTYLPITLN